MLFTKLMSQQLKDQHDDDSPPICKLYSDKMNEQTLQRANAIKKEIGDHKGHLYDINRILNQNNVDILIVGEKPPALYARSGVPQYRISNPELAFKLLREEQEILKQELKNLEDKLASL